MITAADFIEDYPDAIDIENGDFNGVILPMNYGNFTLFIFHKYTMHFLSIHNQVTIESATNAFNDSLYFLKALINKSKYDTERECRNRNLIEK